MPINPTNLSGLLVVDKPFGISSAAVVARVRYAAGRAKTGHAGALDPMATGVLVCCIGSATRAAQHVMQFPKVYEAQVDLSAFTASDDRETPLQPVPVDRPPDEPQIRDKLAAFIGDIPQIPPRFSAVHVGGRRAYRLARQGQELNLPPRIVRIEEIELLEYRWPVARLRVRCGKGTYIRSLARDLGRALATGGHLAALRRTAVGPYDLSRAVTIDRLNSPLSQQDLITPP